MNKEGKTRLLKLASELERCSKGRVLTVPGDGKVGFDMSEIATGEIIGRPQEPGAMCGSSACAMGFAGLHPWFRKQGLSWELWNDDILFTVGQERCDFQDAASIFFDIGLEVSGALFNPYDNCFTGPGPDETPKQVAKRIRAFVAEHSEP